MSRPQMVLVFTVAVENPEDGGDVDTEVLAEVRDKIIKDAMDGMTERKRKAGTLGEPPTKAQAYLLGVSSGWAGYERPPRMGPRGLPQGE